MLQLSPGGTLCARMSSEVNGTATSRRWIPGPESLGKRIRPSSPTKRQGRFGEDNQVEEPDGVEEICLGVGAEKAYRREAKWHVTCVLAGTPCTLMVDTGCPTTLIAPRVAQRLAATVRGRMRPTERAFRGVAGHPVDVRGEIPLRIELGPHGVDTVVIVAEMTHEGILGLETLTALGVTLDFAGGTLSVSGGLITAEEAWCTIEAAGPVIVPPHAEQLVVGRTRVQQGTAPDVGLWRPEPTDDTTGQLWVPTALVRVDNSEVRTTVVNPTDRTIRIDPGGTLGFLQPVLQITEADAEGEVMAQIFEEETPRGKRTLPAYLGNMIEGVASSLNLTK